MASPLPLRRISGDTSLIDVLDRILDKGIVLIASRPATFLGIDLKATGEIVVVAVVEIHLEHTHRTRSGILLHTDSAVPARPMSLAESLESGSHKRDG